MITITLDEEDKEIIMSLARELTGTKVNQEQHGIILQNVAGRIQMLGFRSLEAYLQYLDKNESEMPHLVSAMTIHTTSWFREPMAFEKLESLVPKIWEHKKPGEIIKVLSLACSTGEEVYSIACLLERWRGQSLQYDYQIEGWDIDPISLQTAEQAVYELRSLESLSGQWRSLLQTMINIDSKSFTLVKAIKDRCRFRCHNLSRLPLENQSYDLIFCRNVLIYFNQEEVKSIIDFVARSMDPKGLFCLGVSETSAMDGSKFIAQGGSLYTLKPSKAASNQQPDKTRDPRLLIVDDDPDVLDLLSIWAKEEGVQALLAEHAERALEFLKQEKIGLIISDYRMPGKNGIDLFIEAKKMGYRGSFVLISGFSDKNINEEAKAKGCTEVLAKPLKDLDIKRIIRQNYQRAKLPPKSRPELILIGASTGGTEVLSRMLQNLPNDCPPIVLVQHIAHNFAADFARRLAQTAGLKLGEIKDNEPILPGHLYTSLGDYHIEIKAIGQELRLKFCQDPPRDSHRPSVDVLFQSAIMLRKKIFAALLTGMGRDGAQGLLALKQMGAETFAQNEESCIVFGMPKEAIRLGAALYIGNPQEIRSQLDQRLKSKAVA